MAKIVVDFSDVPEDSGFRTPRLPAGAYAAKISGAEAGKSKAGNDQVVLAFTLDNGRGVYPFYCGLETKSLFKLRRVLTSVGVDAKKKVAFDPARLVGKSIGVILEDDEYDGREKSSVSTVIPAKDVKDEPTNKEIETVDDDDEDVTAPPKKKGKKKGKKVDVESMDIDDV